MEPSTVWRRTALLFYLLILTAGRPELLKFPPQFFEQPDTVYGLPLSVHPSMWRKKAAASQHDTDRALAELNIRMMHLRRLIRAVDYQPTFPIRSSI